MSETASIASQPSDQEVTAIGVAKFIKYLTLYAFPCMLNDDESKSRKDYELYLLESQNEEYLSKFINDSQITTLCIQQTKREEEEGSDLEFSFKISNEVQFESNKSQTSIFIKNTQVIEADKTISSQVQVLSYCDGPPFESMHSLVCYGLLPFFKSYIKKIGKDSSSSSDKMVPSVEKKIAELEVGLLHLQQNIEIPEITLVAHPYVAHVIQEKLLQNKEAKVSDFEDKNEDTQFLNQLQAGVNRWIKEIQKVTKLNRDPSTGTALQEISFWLNLEHSLDKIQEKRESLEVTLTLNILKQAKRFHATTSFDTDTALSSAKSLVKDYNQLMKDFPINDLLSASQLDKISEALQQIFSHLKKVRATKYPVNRIIKLMEALSRDLTTQLMKVISNMHLMSMPYDEFEKIIVACQQVFSTWEDEYDKMQNLLRDMAKKKREEFSKFAWKMNATHKKLQTRLENIKKFRYQHEQLRQVIVRVLKPVAKAVPGVEAGVSKDQTAEKGDKPYVLLPESADTSSIDEVNAAYEIVKNVDCLDFAKEENDEWDAANKRYEERIDRVESRIASHLRDLLGQSKNANEMFRYFSRFNALFVRPHIRGAIGEYQTQLIQRVKDDIEALHNKFKVQYASSTACKMSRVRDLPPVSGSIIWVRQILRQLNAYMKRVEDVLGKDWAQHIEGQKLKADGESFKLKLNTNELFEEWSKKVAEKSLSVSGSIFNVESTRTVVTVRDREPQKITVLKLKVNFLPDVITLAKEVRNMRALGFRTPLSIVNKAHSANQLYPFAISLIESVRTYESTCSKIEEHKMQNISLLTAGLRKDVQACINEGVQITWESYRLDQYVQKLAELVFSFQEKVDDLVIVIKEIDFDVKALETSSYNKQTFEEILGKIQEAVDNMSLHQFSNLAQWVSNLDGLVEQKLIVRLEAGLVEWTKALKGENREDEDDDQDTDPDVTSMVKHRLGGKPQIKKLIHELRITNQQMHLYPSIEVATQDLLYQLSMWQNIILNLPRVVHSRYQVGLETESDNQKTYKKLLSSLPNSGESLENSYAAVHNILREANEYVKTWTNYQSLWDLQGDQLFSLIADDHTVWMNVLEEIKSMRKHFDVAETQKEFGPLVVAFGKVQSKVSMKYDNWHKEVLTKFGSNLGKMMTSLYNDVQKARNELEQQSIDSGGTNESVNFITYTQNIKRKMNTWEKQVEACRSGQNILCRDRFQFPNDWLDSENIQGEWSAFKEIMRRKQDTISSQVASLQIKITEEDKIVESKTSEVLSNWEKDKPIAGDLTPEEAVNIIQILEGKFNRLKEERENVQKAKEALELTELGVRPLSEEKVTNALSELHDLKNVWNELKSIWEKIRDMKETPWLSVQPRKLRQDIENLSAQLKDLPNSFKQYASFEHVRTLLKMYSKVNASIVELKSEAIKERHWRMLMRKLNVNWSLSELQLGKIWDIDLVKNEEIIREVLAIAQGEKALEEYLRQITEVWKNYVLELTNYQNKSKIIKGWDDLFNKVKEHINNVTSMKASPYFKQFEEEATAWEDRLNKINALFDVWIDVQRRWIYLDGIFVGSADIKVLLPVESQRFQSVSTEFLGLMKKVSKSPLVTDVLNIANVQRQLERLADLLGKIQKSLGEYLERQRSSFPRFYFVGDEDLLEIIGNSKDLKKLQKHFKKMFAGVHSIILSEDEKIILGMMSKEGEELKFVTPISIIEHPRINEWLTAMEKEMRVSLAKYLNVAVKEIAGWRTEASIDKDKFMVWLDKYQAQIVVLAAQITWSEAVEANLAGGSTLESTMNVVHNTLNMLADTVLYEQPPVRRRKLEHLIIEYVHQRDVLRALHNEGVNSNKNFDWMSQMRFYFDPKQTDPLHQLSIHVANAKFHYGFEYLGVCDRLVQTPLTDRCYLTMTQALEARLGGSPFGPAGTGKTESVKSLGNQLGRFVLVFNCDETFDFQAMGRIFVGLCQVGAWGCFDEFNRLEERMLSAVSQQIQGIQEALRELMVSKKDSINVELLGKQVRVNPDMAIFITMNPGYAGRSNLPDNLKKLFRSLAMTQPDRQLIAQVMLYSQGFRTAEILAGKVVPFFKLCDEQLSQQSHYDFGLRALKSVLVSAGNVKRERIRQVKEQIVARGDEINETAIAEQLPEQEILIQSVMETMVPKLIAEDIPLLYSLLTDVFPGVEYRQAEMKRLRDELKKVSESKFLVYSNEPNTAGYLWVEKVLQLYQITTIHHGLMMVGPSGSGKTMACKVLLEALQNIDGIEGVAHVIDPKSISKDSLYGYMDPNTREWTDGLFTHILRRIIDSVRGESNKRQWIIFDGDVDPEWVENLNSVLDDNKLLTLPNGERLGIPPNVRIMFEVQDLKYATLATVSRCGMVWFSEDVLTTGMILTNFLNELKHVQVMEGEEDFSNVKTEGISGSEAESKLTNSPILQLQAQVISILAPFFTEDGLIVKCLEYSIPLEHIMDFTRLRALTSLFSMIKQSIRNIIDYNQTHSDFPLANEQVEGYITKSLVSSIVWSMSGDSKLKIREQLSLYIKDISTIDLPNVGGLKNIIDFEVSIQGTWVAWSQKVPQIEVETHKITATDVVVPTMDTVRHESLLYTWLAEHRPVLLCGPPGSGKTMTLFSALRCLPDMEVVGLNFSSATTPELMLKTFDQYCEYRKTPNGIVLAPQQLNKWLIFFCDEINLPDMDKYGTQRVISFLRQMVEHHGFYRITDMQWVSFERIQFVGACNPPTDPGRKPLSHRFLRHVPVVYVDYPGETSLKQIYSTFNRAMLRMLPALRGHADTLTNAMVEFFLKTQERFTHDMQPHYIYSPREMTRWVRGIHEALKPLESLSVEGLVRIWAHEALRLFQDRLVEEEERQWTDDNINEVALKHFPNINKDEALKRPILYSNWLSKDYSAVSQEELRDYVKARLKVFYEEELDVPLVLFNQVLDHVLRIDRVFRQPQGHLLLIGVSGAGKTTLSRFVSWINGLSVFQVKVHNKYTAEDFDEDLRNVLRRSGCKGEKITFIMDESNVMDSSFLERMNTLLANGEVPGLFEGDELTTLMTQCKEGAIREGLMVDSQEELYKWFTQQICRNLHVVFTMNPSADGLKDKASTSPALFNRCVLNWFGDWSLEAYFQVGKEFTNRLDLERMDYQVPDTLPCVAEGLLPANPVYRDVVVNALVFVHQTMHQANVRVQKRGGRTAAITPRHYLDLIAHYMKLSAEKRADLEEQQLHLNNGLKKIEQTVDQVEVMQKSLTNKRQELENMNEAANAKLKQMVQDQQEAEQKKTTGQALKEELAKQEQFVNEKQKTVRLELDQVEPTVNEAKQAVQNIRKKDIQEIKAMKNPPPMVKIAVESICLLLGEKTTDWQSILKVIIKDNFVPSILNFNTDDVTDAIRETMKKKYLSNPDYNFEKVNKASNACGPMVKWVLAQISYADILKRVEPLRNELTELSEAAESNRKKSQETEELIAQLEKSIARYTEEYAALISQAQTIKSDLASVESKVGRSVALLESLSSERTRWDSGSETFKSQMATINGDCLLSSAFMAYGGYFDQHMRTSLFNTWCHHLSEADIYYRSDLARVEYLSNPDDRLRWQANSLPADDLCVENAIILRRYNRYPLIIDPSGQATTFLLNEYKEKKITKTSFLDDSFRKTLESALRFGTPLLVQDVESYDPILNPVLNREVRRTGGRTLITLGDQDIDLSPTFTIFLSTRDPSVEFAPDICSRVTFVNFTVTRSSLQNQCLNAVLKIERPDIDKKRSDLLKIQGEFQLKLRHLEKDLLQSLNESQGNLLENDKIIARLETLKKEAADVAKKVEETDVVMKEVENVSTQYVPLAQSCSNIYFTLEAMNQIHFLYQYSLQLMLDIFSSVLIDNPELKDVEDCKERLRIITKNLFQVTYNRLARGMLHEDQITFATILARIFLKGSTPTGFLENEFQHFLRSQEATLAISDTNKQDNLGLNLHQDQIDSIKRLKKLRVFSKIEDKIRSSKEVKTWITSVTPESQVPEFWVDENNYDNRLSKIAKGMYNLLTIQAIRPDRLLATTQKFISAVLNEAFTESVRGTLDLGSIVELEVTASVPILLCAVQGYDPSGRVEDLAAESGKQLTGIAIGSAEGFSQAEKAINSAAKSGKWVMLKNVHLATSWLISLEKKIHSLQAHPSFRLFLTMEITPKLPVNLLRAGRVLVFEPPPGIKANLLRTLSSISNQRMSKEPVERSRLYFLLAWLNAIVQERLRYVPLGYSKKYEFGESDFKCALDTIDTWVDNAAMGRTNLPPEKIPWIALQTLLGSCIYGGKIDNSFDQRLLNSFLGYLFTEKCFDNDFALVADSDDGNSIAFPESTKHADILQWIHKLPDSQTPSWLGLPNSAEKVLLTNLASKLTTDILTLVATDEAALEDAKQEKGQAMIGNILKMQQSLEDDEELVVGQSKTKRTIEVGDGRPAWMRQLYQSTQAWLQILPKSVNPLQRTVENIKDPMYRCFEREVNSGCNLLIAVRKDLEDVAEVCRGVKKPTNHHRAMMADLAKGIIPKVWIRYAIPPGLTVIQWIQDFADRIRQLVNISQTAANSGVASLKTIKVWLGGLFMAEAYITATRQSVAQSNKWALEELFLDVELGEGPIDGNTCVVTGLRLMGSEIVNSRTLKLSTSIYKDIDVCRLKWIRMEKSQQQLLETSSANDKVCLPIYLNAARSTVLFTLYFGTTDSSYDFYKRGVAILSSSLG